MKVEIETNDDVWTADEKRLGQVRYLYQRTSGVNPELKLYEFYMYVISFDISEDFYVPTDFIASRDPEQKTIKLTVDMKKVLSQGWAHVPSFIARGDAVKEL